MLQNIFKTSNDYTLTMLRLVAGFVYFAHGAQKLGLLGGPGLQVRLTGLSGAVHMPLALAYLVFAAEFFGGLGLIVGLLGRIAALGIFCDMLGAVILVHHRFGLFMNWTGRQPGEGFEFHLLALAMTLTIVIRGSGALSIDRLLMPRKLGGVVRTDRPTFRRSA